MVVEITHELFTDTDEVANLKYLIQLCYFKDRYFLYADYTVIKDLEVYLLLDEIDKDLIIQGFNKYVQSPEKPSVVIRKETGEDHFSPEEAIRYLNQPISIILENSLNDAYFMQAVIDHFDSTNEINRHFENNWIQFDNAGGAGNIKNLINGKLSAYKSWPKRSKEKYLRCFVIFDSDKISPVSPLKQDKINCENYLIEKNIVYHILSKREMENYVPDVVIDKISDEYLKLYLKLSPLQKDYFDLQNGLKNRTDRNIDQKILELFENLHDDNWKDLCKGLKTSPYDKNFKSEFPKLFQHKLINKNSLNSRLTDSESPNEFEQIVNKTLSLI